MPCSTFLTIPFTFAGAEIGTSRKQRNIDTNTEMLENKELSNPNEKVISSRVVSIQLTKIGKYVSYGGFNVKYHFWRTYFVILFTKY